LLPGNQGEGQQYASYQPNYSPVAYNSGTANKEIAYASYAPPNVAASDVRNTFNYGGAQNVASAVRNTVVGENQYIAPPKITFGQPSGGYTQTQTSY
jgi:hypothetical protein